MTPSLPISQDPVKAAEDFVKENNGTKMKTGKTIALILWLLIVAPIWYYLFYKILIAVNASELMMFLFWIYVPVGVITGIISKVSEGKD